jgi:3-vinyl bacteriochlorophyllide hydratase
MTASRSHASRSSHQTTPRANGLYTPAERIRRDQSPWTMVQGILAPLQFLVFLVSLALVLRALLTGDGQDAATISVIVKTLVLYSIMVTGSLWEKDVYGVYLFAPAFFWEDAVSFIVIALHTAYLLAITTHSLSERDQLLLALAAYSTYVVNAGQFVWKLRSARLQAAAGTADHFEAAMADLAGGMQ